MAEADENATRLAEMGRRIVVNALWDDEAKVWVAESDDLPLVTEAPTVEDLIAKLPGIIQDLIECQDEGSAQDVDVPFEVVMRANSYVRVHARET